MSIDEFTNEEFKKKFIKTLNLFRKKPTSIIQMMEIFKIGFLRLSRKSINQDFATSIDEFKEILKNFKPLKELDLNDRLSEYAEKYIDGCDPDEDDVQMYMTGKKVLDKIPEEYINEDCVIVHDNLVTDPEQFLIKMLLNIEDEEKFGRKLLRDPSYTQVGVSYKLTEPSFGIICLIFAKNYAKKEESVVELPEGDLTELKQAFDLFDVQEIGKISPKDTLEAMKAINFNEKNPELYDIMEELIDAGTLVDFPTFAWHIVDRISDKNSKKGLRRIFNLFVDDHEANTISLGALKKICKRLKEKNAEREVDNLINGPNSGATLTFDEFYQFMNGKEK